MMYNTYKFKSLVTAREEQKKIKETYGYAPTIFKEIDKKSRKTRYVVVKPFGLLKI